MEKGRRLNERQEEAANTKEGHVLVLAGAGSGKTTVLTERIARLVEAGEAEPGEILSITFTNKAAKEMAGRIRKRLEGQDISRMWISTFHSMCARMLRMFPQPLGFTARFTIYDQDDAAKVIRRVVDELGKSEDRFDAKNLQRVFSAYKNSSYAFMETKPDDEEDWSFMGWMNLHYGDLPPAIRSTYVDAYNGYCETLLKENAMDFDDLLLFTLRLLRASEGVRRMYQDKFRYVLVDEYQDTNPVQYELVKILSGGHGNLFAVGDDDQAIYGFRGATIENILGFAQDFPDARIIRLEQNYRSVQPILDSANGLIAHNTQRLGKTLWSESRSEETPLEVFCPTDDDQAAYISADIAARHSARGEPYSSNVVLYRMHAVSRAVEEHMLRARIPYRIIGGVGFYGRREIRDMIAYLSLLANPAADAYLLRIINVPKRGIGPGKVSALQQASMENHVPILEVMRRADELLHDKALIRKSKAFIDMYDAMAKDMEDTPSDQMVERVYMLSGYKDMLDFERSDQAEDRKANIRELAAAALEFEQSNPKQFVEFLQQMTLMTEQDRQKDGQDCVTLMTVHAAKGLEFDNVYVAGMTDGGFPSRLAIREGHIEEERRLCYVAMTRARKKLVMLSPGESYLWGSTVQNIPSRFLREVPKGLCRTMDYPAKADNELLPYDDLECAAGLW